MKLRKALEKIYGEKQDVKIIHYYESVNCKHQTGQPSLRGKLKTERDFTLLFLWFKIDWNAYINGKAVKSCLCTVDSSSFSPDPKP